MTPSRLEEIRPVAVAGAATAVTAASVPTTPQRYESCTTGTHAAAPSTHSENKPLCLQWSVALRRQCLRKGALGCTPNEIFTQSSHGNHGNHSSSSSNSSTATTREIQVLMPANGTSVVTWTDDTTQNNRKNTKTTHQPMIDSSELVSRVLQVLSASAAASNKTTTTTAAEASTILSPSKSNTSNNSSNGNGNGNSFTSPLSTLASTLWSPIKVTASVVTYTAQTTSSAVNFLANAMVGTPDYHSTSVTVDTTSTSIATANTSSSTTPAYQVVPSNLWTDALHNDSVYAAATTTTTTTGLPFAPNDTNTTVVDVGLTAACVRYVQHVLAKEATQTAAIVPVAEFGQWLLRHIQDEEQQQESIAVGNADDSGSMPVITTAMLSNFVTRLPQSHWDIILESLVKMSETTEAGTLQRVHRDKEGNVVAAHGPAPSSTAVYVIGEEVPYRSLDVRLTLHELQTYIEKQERMREKCTVDIAFVRKAVQAEQAKMAAAKQSKHSTAMKILLSRYKQFQQQLGTAESTLLNLELIRSQVESAADQASVVETLHAAAQSLKTMNAATSVDALDDVLDDLQEQFGELRLISDTLGESMDSTSFDDEALLAELMSLPEPVVQVAATDANHLAATVLSGESAAATSVVHGIQAAASGPGEAAPSVAAVPGVSAPPTSTSVGLAANGDAALSCPRNQNTVAVV